MLSLLFDWMLDGAENDCLCMFMWCFVVFFFFLISPIYLCLQIDVLEVDGEYYGTFLYYRVDWSSSINSFTLSSLICMPSIRLFWVSSLWSSSEARPTNYTLQSSPWYKGNTKVNLSYTFLSLYSMEYHEWLIGIWDTISILCCRHHLRWRSRRWREEIKQLHCLLINILYQKPAEMQISDVAENYYIVACL